MDPRGNGAKAFGESGDLFQKTAAVGSLGSANVVSGIRAVLVGGAPANKQATTSRQRVFAKASSATFSRMWILAIPNSPAVSCAAATANSQVAYALPSN